MTRYVISSDWHGDINTAGFPRFSDVEKAATESVEYAIRNQTDYYIFGGDLITQDPNLDLYIRNICLVQRLTQKLENAGIRSYWLVGNHDIWKVDDNITALDPIDNYPITKVIKEPSFENGIIFFPYTYHDYDLDDFLKSCYENGIEAELIVGHLNIEGISKGSETNDFPRGKDVFLPLESIKKYYPKAVICNGHYHNRQVYNTINIIGSLLNLTRGEIDNKPGFLDITI